MMTREELLEHLRDALTHLYDPNRLRKNALISLFDLAERSSPPLALQRILTEAISSLEPAADVPSQAHVWRVYDLLFCRYVQQLSVQTVADQLGLSVRHLRREQRSALDILAYQLEKQFGLNKMPAGNKAEGPALRAIEAGAAIDKELAWIKKIPLEEPADLGQELSDVLDLVHSLSAQHKVRLDVELGDGIPALAVHRVALNQVLLSLLSVAISWAAGGRVTVSARPGRWQVEIQVQANRAFPQESVLSKDNTASLDIAQSLAELCGGRLHVSIEHDAFSARLMLPTSERLPVLVIDDNADTLQLLQHYAAGTRYRLIGTRDPEEIFDLVERFSPQVIVLDVMMPQVDGWRVLGRLRQHPQTSELPIVISTILAQEQLALSLGASAFVRKPFTQEVFLETLDHQAAALDELAGRTEQGFRL